MSNTPLGKLAVAIATLGPVGHFPKAPGTWGSLAALVAAPWLFLDLALGWRIFLLTVLFFVGVWACNNGERACGEKDPSCVVVDELFGMWLTLLFFPGLPLWYLLVGFAAFRFFDILKPWPIKWAEHAFPGGAGIMLDDAAAGIYALGVLHLIAHFIQ